MGACRGDLLRKLQKGFQASLGHEATEGGERKREMLRGQRWNSISVSTSSRNLGRSSRTGAPALSLSRWGLGEVASRLWSLPLVSSSVKARGHFCPPVVHALCRTDTDGLLAELTSSSSGSVPVCPQHPFYSRDTFLCPLRWPSSDAAGTSIRRNRRASAECF